MTPRRRARDILASPALWVFIGSLSLAAVYMRATLRHLTKGIVGGRSDGYENLWNDYWLRTALLHLHQSPFFSNWIEYPTGTSLRFHTLNPLSGIIALPIAPLIGDIATLNLKLFFSLVLCPFFAWLLIRDLVGNPLAAFAGAVVFTYANDQMVINTLTATENYLMGAALLPLFCFVLLRAATRPRWGGYATAAVATLLALSLTDWQYTLFAILFAALFFLVTALMERSWQEAGLLLLRVGVIGGAWAVIVLPTLIVPMLQEARRSPWLDLGLDQATAHAKALTQFVRPGYENPGYLVLVVTVVGLILFWRNNDTRGDRSAVIFWAVIVAISCMLSLGPRLLLTPDRNTGIPLPFALMTRLPLLSSSRKPFLFYASLGMLGIGVLVAFALREWSPLIARLAGRIAGARLTPRVNRSISGVAVALLLIPTLLPSLVKTREGDVIAADWPPFYRDVLAKDTASYAILETPLFVGQKGRSDAVYAGFQTIYNKQRFGSSIARDHKADNPDLFLKRATFFRDFFYLDKRAYTDLYRPPSTPDFLATPALDRVGLPLLQYYHVRYIVLYLDALQETSPGAINAARSLVRQALGNDVRPVYTDAEMEAYRVPDGPPLAEPLFVDTGTNGWWPPEKTPDGTPYRWADTRDGKAAEILLFNVSDTPRTARVQFTVFNYTAPRAVTVAMDGTQADTFTLAPNAVRDVTLDLSVAPGMHLITLASPLPPIPIANNGGKDNRLLSFGARQVRVQETG